jgi:reactive intermediate/imine deaminase
LSLSLRPNFNKQKGNKTQRRSHDCYLYFVLEAKRREIRTPNSPPPAFSYSQGIVVGDFLFIAGQVPKDPVTGDVPVTFVDQVRRTLDNLAAIAAAAGTSLANAVRVSVYLDDIETVHQLDPVYLEYFVAPYPARTTIQAGLRGYLVEIDAIVAT